MNTDTGARGIYVTRRPSLLGDFTQQCSPGDYLVDVGADAPICADAATAQQLSAGGATIISRFSGGGSTSPTAQPPMTPGAGPAPASPSIISQLEHTTGLSGSSLAIGMVVLLMLTRKK